jgi:hypothetical protein
MNMTDNTKRWLVTAGVILLIGTGSFFLLHEKNERGYRLEGIRTKQGWGYVIYRNHSPFIYQDNIPGVSGMVPFRNKEIALEVGNLVVKKLRAGKNPALSRAEVNKVLR